MELRKWKINSVELRDKWREAGLEMDEENYSINDNSALTPCKVLGLAWDSDLDIFQFDTRSLEKFLSKKINSKRYVLQVAGRIFDPVGFLGPFTIKIKCLIQDIWCLGLDWDDPLPKTLITKINEWCKEIKNLHLIKIPRYFFAEAKTNEIVEAQLHCFSDASKRAYGTVVYISLIEKRGNQIKFASPHFGGLWEANIGAMKRILLKVTKSTVLTFEELTTLVTQIEAVLNSRPLCPLSADPADIQPLTPGHFLVGAPLLSIPEPSDSLTNISLSSRWSLIQSLRSKFGERWSQEYLNSLQFRAKWKLPQLNIKPGQLVLLIIARAPWNGNWPELKGHILEKMD
ncbi:hypothetical protein HNY73_006564 [Argiope bruennichi]|uniref:DUF5641 domain-containing protein n=1 Tax=Argiope bruennichi TaxID=94029 RepID=A0A8T0FI77_ARGBR|nr:hypothetical protein HNY73_006564 [Argiope bruennichi]